MMNKVLQSSRLSLNDITKRGRGGGRRGDVLSGTCFLLFLVLQVTLVVVTPTTSTTAATTTVTQEGNHNHFITRHYWKLVQPRINTNTTTFKTEEWTVSPDIAALFHPDDLAILQHEIYTEFLDFPLSDHRLWPLLPKTNTKTKTTTAAGQEDTLLPVPIVKEKLPLIFFEQRQYRETEKEEDMDTAAGVMNEFYDALMKQAKVLNLTYHFSNHHRHHGKESVSAITTTATSITNNAITRSLTTSTTAGGGDGEKGEDGKGEGEGEGDMVQGKGHEGEGEGEGEGEESNAHSNINSHDNKDEEIEDSSSSAFFSTPSTWIVADHFPQSKRYALYGGKYKWGEQSTLYRTFKSDLKGSTTTLNPSVNSHSFLCMTNYQSPMERIEQCLLSHTSIVSDGSRKREDCSTSPSSLSPLLLLLQDGEEEEKRKVRNALRWCLHEPFRVLSGMYDEEMISRHLSPLLWLDESEAMRVGGEMDKERLTDQALLIFHSTLEAVRTCLPLTLSSLPSLSSSKITQASSALQDKSDISNVIKQHSQSPLLQEVLLRLMIPQAVQTESGQSSSSKCDDEKDKKKVVLSLKQLSKYELLLYDALLCKINQFRGL